VHLKFWGVRGSVPVPGRETVKYGGNTTCLEVRTNDGTLLIIDAGTGIRLLGLELMKGEFGRGTGTAHILFTHSHWDHIQGFPFFIPAYIGSKDDAGNRVEGQCNRFHLYGASDVDDRLEATLRGQMEHFYFPVDLNYLSAQINFHPMVGNNVQIGSATITAKRLIHPNGVLGYRIQDGDHVLCIATDCEHPSDGSIDRNLLELAQNADILVYDAQYTPEEYNPAAHGLQGPSKIGWGHSTFMEGIRVAQEAKVKRLVLTHHDPLHNDERVAEMERRAQAILPGTLAAYEGLVLQL
jgi:phosphoribosyl 1,2-cyclic phosphodiesterase